MSHLPTLAAIAGVYLIAVASPGPNFFLASQLALSGERQLGFAVAAGIASGSVVWASLAVAGVVTLLAHVAWLYAALRIGAAAYLIWFGLKLLWGARRAVDARSPVRIPDSTGSAFRAGLLTNLTNPKAAAFWTSVFGSIYPAHAPIWLAPATLLIVVAICAGWYMCVALCFGSALVQRRYLKARRWIDAGCGTLLVGFGAHLAASR